MATEEYQVGYDTGYQDGWNAAQQPEAVAWRARDANGRWMYGDLPAPELPAGEPELLALAAPQQTEAVPPDVTDAMVDAYLSFASQATHLHHPEVPYHGTVNGDDADLWRRRLIKLALQRALAAASKGQS